MKQVAKTRTVGRGQKGDVWFLAEVDVPAEDGTLYDWRAIVIPVKGRRTLLGNPRAFGVEESFDEAMRKALARPLRRKWSKTKEPDRQERESRVRAWRQVKLERCRAPTLHARGQGFESPRLNQPKGDKGFSGFASPEEPRKADAHPETDFQAALEAFYSAGASATAHLGP